jgi:hypothetical protein
VRSDIRNRHASKSTRPATNRSGFPHQAGDTLASHTSAWLAQLSVHAWCAVRAAAIIVNSLDLLGELLIGLSPGRYSLVLPGVERAVGYAQHATQQNDRVTRLLLRKEPRAAHPSVVLVKKAMAFASTSRSLHAPPRAHDIYASQRWTLLSAKPISRQNSAIDLPQWRINATVSDLNSLVNLRLERLSIQADSIGASTPRFQASVEVG